jgi:hypothetical protein
MRYQEVVRISSRFTIRGSAAACFLVLFTLLLKAEDWKTSDGKTYTGVTVVKVEDDAVTILCNDGGARVELSTLPLALQQKFHYDPQKAQAAAAKYIAEQKASADALDAEKKAQQAQEKQRQAKLQQDSIEQQKSSAEAQARQLQQVQLQAKVEQLKQDAVFVCGRVQVVDGGLLVTCEAEAAYPWSDVPTGMTRAGAGTFFLTHYAKEKSAVDGDYIEAVAFPNGRYKYTTALGAEATVHAFSTVPPEN